MTHKPFFIDLHSKRVLILGGGEIAIRKLGAFSGSGALITL
ncbi:NAD(P)-dependent oxidoreductase, partial [bacterium]|nr:NAD(P)-dependent oxidoreductase [bacterium]